VIDVQFATGAKRDRFKKLIDQLYVYPLDPDILSSVDIA
jgi:hypothetical protein